jgi:isoquinoline 1-oxidoreductase subunit alpha
VITVNVNNQTYQVAANDNDLLLWVLRDELGLIGTKFGCGVGICGACVVHLDGAAVRSCVTPLSATEGRTITTIEGLANDYELHPVQQAFLEQQVPQCAWCMSGQMMTAAAFLQQTPNPSEADIANALSANYCRCGCYARIRSAVAQAAKVQAHS